MKSRVACSAVVVVIGALAGPVWAKPSLEVKQEAVPAEVASSIREALHPDCYKVTDGQRSLRLWIPKVVAAAGEQTPVPYSVLKEGTVLGVLEIKGSGWSDFRAQALPEGLFILRLVFQPQDGDHMGVAPFPEFVALTPVAEDKNLDPISHDEVVQLSTQTLETGHPAVMFLNPFFQKPTFEFPKINKNAFEHSVLNVKTQATIAGDKKVDFFLGLIIEGASEDAN